jgi:UDP-2,3-diacylglucosamine pyrophosphatase LpxH
MTRTLIISDLHLGGRFFHGILTRPEPLRRLLAELERIDRLVLLGDAIELMERRPRRALAIAEPVLSAIGNRLGSGREVVLVPGNHDLPLVRPWIDEIGPDLDVATDVPHDSTPALAAVTSWLAPARVRVSYPGVWLEGGVWATHGHYLDEHLLPVSTYGFTRARQGWMPTEGARPADYERGRRRSLAPATRLLPRPGAWLVDELAELARASTMPVIKRRLLQPRYAKVISRMLRAQVNRAALPALARVVENLKVEADWVVFGHVHRLGPLSGDDRSLWQGRSGRAGGFRIVNTGSWLYEPILVHRASPPHPYWPGGAILLEPGSHPRAIGLLDDLPLDALRDH